MKRLSTAVPALDWLKTYNPVAFSDDVAAGLIIAVMLIPQGIAFALLAGLPPIMGLYAAVIPPLAYAFFGSSHHLMVGPAAIISLLTVEGVSKLEPIGTPAYVNLVVVLMLATGVISLLLGLVRGGFIVRFISHGVISGFTSAAAIIIAFSQLDNLLGITVTTEHQRLFTKNNTFLAVVDVGKESIHANPATVALGLGTIAVLVIYRETLRRLPPRLLLIASKFPYPLFVIAAATAIVYGFGLQQHGVAIIGEIPRGLPSPLLPDVDEGIIAELMPAAITIAFIGFVESNAVARTIATREKDKLDANQDLRALGLANIAGSFFAGYPVAGSFSRTAVAYQVGGRTQMTGIVSAAFIFLTLLFLTPLFFYLPLAVLAGIIIVSVSGLVNFREMVHVFQLRWVDGWTVLLTFLATLILGVDYGLLIGVVFSIAVFVWQNAYPRTIELGYVATEDVFRDLKYYPDARVYPEVLIVQIDAPLYFANMTGLEDWLEDTLQRRPRTRSVIFDFTTVTAVDAVTVDIFRDLLLSYRAAGIQILIGGMRDPVKDIFNRADWAREHASELAFPTVAAALRACGVDVSSNHVERGPSFAATDSS